MKMMVGLAFLMVGFSANASLSISCYKHLNRATYEGQGEVLTIGSTDDVFDGPASESASGWSMQYQGSEYPPAKAVAKASRVNADDSIDGIEIQVGDETLKITNPYDDFPDLEIIPRKGASQKFGCIGSQD